MPKRLLKPEEQIPGLDGVTVGDFWAWAYSDLQSNTIRPLFAEYLVGRCLGVLTQPRIEWDYVDFIYREKKIEVKSSAYLQAWEQRKPSFISFDIAPKEKPWIAESNTFGGPGRHADCYVLCVHAERDKSQCRVDDPSQWHFYVLSSRTLADVFGAQRTARLSRIQRLCDHVEYGGLRETIDAALGFSSGDLLS
jgi:hypothetical protein